MTTTKKDMIQQVAESAEISKVAATLAVEAALSVIAASLNRGDDVKIYGKTTVRSLVAESSK